MGSKAPLYPIWALIREVRARTGMTQSELAEKSGVPQSKISTYENARVLPDIPTLITLAESAGFELEFTLTERDPQRHNLQHRTFTEAIDANAQAIETARALRNATSTTR